MNLKNLYASLLLAFLSLGAAHAADAPATEDATQLAAPAQKSDNAGAVTPDSGSTLKQPKTPAESRTQANRGRPATRRHARRVSRAQMRHMKRTRRATQSRPPVAETVTQ